MCGRFTLTTSAIGQLPSLFDLPEAELPLLTPRYNIAPTQPVAAVRELANGRRMDLLRWGLVPAWSKDPKKGPLLINARADTVAEKPSFRSAFKTRRCLIPADGFFEWKTEGKAKQPMYFQLPGAFAFAGLWEHWEGHDGQAIDSCTLITTDANERVASVHDRMPVILPKEAFAAWLDPKQHDPAVLLTMLRPYPPDRMTVTAVNPAVNSARHDDPNCITPLATLFGPP